MDSIVNVDMANSWNGEAGDEWAKRWEHHDLAVARHQAVLLEAAPIGASDRVVDIGCGNGILTRDAARAAVDGHALGLDLSLQMLARAREQATAEGLTNVTFEQGDAQVRPFERASSDLAVSRFGVMFFSDRVAAFANVGGGLRSGGRLALMAWRSFDHNEWQQCIFDALEAGRALPHPPVGVPGMFDLADPDTTRDSLTAAGFEGVEVTAVEAVFWAGADPDDAYGFLATSGPVRNLSEGLDEAQRAAGLERLRASIDDHATPEGVLFGSSVWVITARRP